MNHPQLPGINVQDDWRILEVGSGPNKLFPQSTTIDISPTGQPDILHDLNDIPYPLPEGRFDLVVCLHVLEHVQDLVGTTTELHRVLKPGGLLFVEVPYFSSVHFYTDPTHVHAFSTRSFDYYVEGTPVSRFGYSPARFTKERVEIVVPGGGPVNRLLRRWINGHHRLYEERLAFIFPRHTLQFTLRAVK
ncbi:MAG: class I SAM-dependent methyltransferase [Armatimonadetes bacterium]|nr:class I SAM-dependent methyltransferase [Armatimonadota bacterium]